MHAYIHARANITQEQDNLLVTCMREAYRTNAYSIFPDPVYTKTRLCICIFRKYVYAYIMEFFVFELCGCAHLCHHCFCIVHLCACLHVTNSTQIETGIQHNMKPRYFVISWYKSNREHAVMIDFVLHKHARISMSEKNKMETSVCRSAREWVGGNIFERHKREGDP